MHKRHGFFPHDVTNMSCQSELNENLNNAGLKLTSSACKTRDIGAKIEQ